MNQKNVESRLARTFGLGFLGFGLALTCPPAIPDASAQSGQAVSVEDYKALQDRVVRLEALLEKVSNQLEQKQAADSQERQQRLEAEKEIGALRTEMTKVKTLSRDNFEQVSALRTSAPVDGGSKYAPARGGCVTFQGAFLGGNVGWAYNDTNWVDRDAWVDNFSTDWSLGTVSSAEDGISGGLQAGYNRQRDCTLFGLVADVSFADLDQSELYDSSGGTGTALTINHDVNAWGTLRTRAGVVVDNLLLYATGGLAWADIDHSWTITDPNNPTQSFSSNGVRWGGVGGVGTQLAINDRVSLSSELLYLKFAEESVSGTTVSNGQPVSFDSQDSMWVSRLGVNFKLGPLGSGQ
ncbi:MAG: outer membrane beta-barrel protein [Pseudomonadota bacterium]|nr:outer membrane beta-barrel protein [Pseudomonadota bacterium]